MAESAAHWVDHVFPQGVPVRQWVLSLPFELRPALGYNARLTAAALRVWMRAIVGDYRSRARSIGCPGAIHTGALTVIQRASQTLKLDPHFHTLLLDGVYVRAPNDTLTFQALGPPTIQDIGRITEIVAQRIVRLLKRFGLDPEASETERTDSANEPEDALLDAMAASSVSGTVGIGNRQGCFVMRMGLADTIPVAKAKPGLCADADGFNIHAGARVSGHDRKGLERLCRYLGRGPIASDRLRELGGNRIAYRLRKPLRDGTTHLVFTDIELLEKLVPLLPPPRVHQTRFHGILAPHARLRRDVVPKSIASSANADPPRKKRPSWAALLARVFSIDVLACSRCNGPLKIIAAITDPGALRRILDHLGLPTDPPQPHPARPPPVSDLGFEPFSA